MRINAGSHKGTRLIAPAGDDVRPTSDRARQAIFNVLMHRFDAVRGAKVLDAFAGSGALGLEALSRGAESLVAFELAKPALEALKHNIKACHEIARTLVFTCDARNPPSAASHKHYAPCSLIFLDPPYEKGLIPPTLAALQAAGWIAPEVLIAAEMSTKETLPEIDGFTVEDERRYGKAKIALLRSTP
jgi:16S rRNA (guanine966-N2)-methyltransferase